MTDQISGASASTAATYMAAAIVSTLVATSGIDPTKVATAVRGFAAGMSPSLPAGYRADVQRQLASFASIITGGPAI